MELKYLLTNKKEMHKAGWDNCDIIIISGDAYVDHPSFGAAIIGRYLESLGYKTGIIAQPDWNNDEEFLKLGIPNLFVGVTAGNIDSMLAHYTANKKLRSDDDYTPGNVHGKRPNRATIPYTNKIKQLMPGMPVVIGGLEASMRRLGHYDYWSDKIRKSILLDSKADILVYGMGENQIKEIAKRIAYSESLEHIAGTVISASQKSFNIENYKDCIYLPDFNEICNDQDKFIQMTEIIEENLNPYNAKTLIQKTENKYVIVNPPAIPLTTEELDQLYEFNYTGKPHNSYKEKIPAYEMIKDSVTILRGCAGGCSFCSLGLHQGKILQSRSKGSITKEIEKLVSQKDFKGVISDLGGPTANLYMLGCKSTEIMKKCAKPSCLHPDICKNFSYKLDSLIDLMNSLKKFKEIKKIHISSGIRLDVALKNPEYIRLLVKNNVGGHLKVAPEHVDNNILDLMRKPPFETYLQFSKLFYDISKECKKNQYLLPYLMANFPGCTQKEMRKVEKYLKQNKIKVEQVQDFIPLPMTLAAAMYYTEKNLKSKKPIVVSKSMKHRKVQKDCIFWWKKGEK